MAAILEKRCIKNLKEVWSKIRSIGICRSSTGTSTTTLPQNITLHNYKSFAIILVYVVQCVRSILKVNWYERFQNKNVEFSVRCRPFASNDHMVQNPPCWRTSSLLFLHWDIKTKRSESVKLDLPLF